MMEMRGGWVLEVDIKSFFDTLDHRQLQQLVRRRVGDGVLLRLIGKWLNAGVQHHGDFSRPEAGTPQGGVISPLLANIYLHEVLDEWVEQEVKPRLAGRSFLIRYADDFVMGFESEADARRVLEVLPKRFGKYGLTLHPEKTRLLRYERPRDGGAGGASPESFDFLGFTHFWAKSRTGWWHIKLKTATNRLSRALKRVRAWCRRFRHLPLQTQHQYLCRMMRGHCNYYGVRGNLRSLARFRQEVQKAWKKWLTRRSQRGLNWERYNELLLGRFALPHARLNPHLRPANP